MNLYQIANQYENILKQTFDQETGEVNEEALKKFELIKSDIKEKGIAIASYIKNLDAERKAIEEAKLAMAERESRLNKRASYLTTYLQSNMERLGINEISCPYFIIKIKKNPVSVDDFAHNLIPQEYKRIVTEEKIDKKKIKEDLQKGVLIPGAKFKQSNRLEIR